MSGSFSDMVAESIAKAFRQLMWVLVIGWLLAVGFGSFIIYLFIKGYLT